jgi:L-threonylcarbamoyladenylate synthase
MRIITADELTRTPALYQDIASILSNDGLVCFPVGSSYRLAASLLSTDAVMRLLQSKRRASHHPALIFVASADAARSVAKDLPPAACRLLEAFWPGPLTLLADLGVELPPKVAKTLTRATGKIGIRCPCSPIAAQVVREFGGPLLVSSANLERKAGAGSVAQVRKNFQQKIDVCVDAGDLPSVPPSTLVEITETGWRVTREGAIPASKIETVLGRNLPA